MSDGEQQPDDPDTKQDDFPWKIIISLALACGVIATCLLVIGWYLAPVY